MSKFRVGDRIRYKGFKGEARQERVFANNPRIIGSMDEEFVHLLDLDGGDYGSTTTEFINRFWELDENGMDVVFQWLEANT